MTVPVGSQPPYPPETTEEDTHDALAWLGATAALAVAVVVTARSAPDAMLWGPLAAALIIGALSGSRAFIASPLFVGGGAPVWMSWAESLHPGSIYDQDTGAQGASLVVAFLTLATMVAASIGIAIGILVRRFATRA